MRRVTALVVLAVLTAVPAAAGAESPLLVDAAWLHARLGDPAVRVVDMVSDPAHYRRGHVPGALYLHFDDTRVALPGGAFRTLTADEAARLFGALGIAAGTQVVIYDDAGGLHAARLFFTLDAFGHPRVALLDGGIRAWRRARLPLTRESPAVAPTAYRPTLRPERVASAETILAGLRDPRVAIVDARTPAEYSGREAHARRGGHIPGAVNVEWSDNLRADGTFKPVAELRAMYAARGVTPDRTVLAYCQTHHRSALSYFALRLAGFPAVAGYDRSWAEWGNRPDLPVER